MKAIETEEQKDTMLPILQLTNREREVLSWLANGYEYNQIARELLLTINGVRVHIKSLYRKLGVSNNVQAAKLYWDYTFEKRSIRA